MAEVARTDSRLQCTAAKARIAGQILRSEAGLARKGLLVIGKLGQPDNQLRSNQQNFRGASRYRERQEHPLGACGGRADQKWRR